MHQGSVDELRTTQERRREGSDPMSSSSGKNTNCPNVTFVQETLQFNFCKPVKVHEEEDHQEQYIASNTKLNNPNDINSPTTDTTRSNGSSTGTSTTNRAKSRKARVYTFYDFLIKTYPFLISKNGHNNEKNNTNPDKTKNENNNTIILDVAGGKGHLSWLFTNLHHHIQSIIIDPRNDLISPNKNYKSILKSISYLEDHPKIVQQRNVVGTKEYQPLAALLPTLIEKREERKKKQIQQLLLQKIQMQMKQMDNEDHNCMKKHNGDNDNYDDNDDRNDHYYPWKCPRRMKIYFDNKLVNIMTKMKISKDVQQPWSQYWKEANNNTTINSNKEDSSKNKIIQCPNEAWNCISNTNLIVGFHPDQATEAIVDFAIERKIPFCIVPCCVFPKEFPNRFLSSSSSSTTTTITTTEFQNEGDSNENTKHDEKYFVRDYQTFLTYLKDKDERIREAQLDFQFTDTARRVVLYMLPEDFQQ